LNDFALNDFAMNDREQASGGSGIGAAALLLGVAAGAAALLLATPQGKRILEQLSGRTEDWAVQAAAFLAASREKVVSSVEASAPDETDGRLREKL